VAPRFLRKRLRVLIVDDDAAIHAGFRSAGAVAVFVKTDVAGLVRFLERLSQPARG
jgi:hypothetical protein